MISSIHLLLHTNWTTYNQCKPLVATEVCGHYCEKCALYLSSKFNHSGSLPHELNLMKCTLRIGRQLEAESSWLFAATGSRNTSLMRQKLSITYAQSHASLINGDHSSGLQQQWLTFQISCQRIHHLSTHILFFHPNFVSHTLPSQSGH